MQFINNEGVLRDMDARGFHGVDLNCKTCGALGVAATGTF